MNSEPENSPVLLSPEDLAAADERILERIRFLFRQAGDNLPALELAQQVMTYRLKGRQP